MKLGKLPATPDDRDIRLRAVLPAAPEALPTPPARFGYGRLYPDWGMLGNDRYGCCVFAGAAHETMLWNHLSGHEVPFTPAAVLSDYAAVTGFRQDDPATDNGANVRDALSYRQKTGIIDAAGIRHKIGAFVALTAGDYPELMQATYLFEAVAIGFLVPSTVWAQRDAGQVWDVVDANAEIEGGHYVPITGRFSVADNGCVTWGTRQGMTRRFYEKYADEAWAMVTTEELKDGVNRRGLDLTKLNAALRQLGG